MSENKRKLKAVSFSLNDEYEIGLFNHIDKIKNFSGYVKRLIDKDMRSLDVGLIQNVQEINIAEHDISNEDREAMSSFF